MKAFTFNMLMAAASLATVSAGPDIPSLVAGAFSPGSVGANALSSALKFEGLGDGFDNSTSGSGADNLAVKPLTLGTLSDFAPDFVADFAKTAARAVKAAPLDALGGPDLKKLLDDAARAGARLAQAPARLAAQLAPGGDAHDVLALLAGAGDGAAAVRDALMEFSVPVTGLRDKLERRIERAVNAGDGGDDDALGGDLLSMITDEVSDGAQALMAKLGPAMTQALQGTGGGGGGRRLRGEGASGQRRRLLDVARSLSGGGNGADRAKYEADGPGGAWANAPRKAVTISIGVGAALLTCCPRGLDHATGDCKAKGAAAGGATIVPGAASSTGDDDPSLNAEFSFNVDVGGITVVIPYCAAGSFQKDAGECPPAFMSFDSGFGGTVALSVTDGKYVTTATKSGSRVTGSVSSGRGGIVRVNPPKFLGSKAIGDKCRWSLGQPQDAAAVQVDTGKALGRPSVSIGLIFDYLGVAGAGVDLDVEVDFGYMTAPPNHVVGRDSQFWKRMLPNGVKFMLADTLSDEVGELQGFALNFDPFANLHSKWRRTNADGTVTTIPLSPDFTSNANTLADENAANNKALTLKNDVADAKKKADKAWKAVKDLIGWLNSAEFDAPKTTDDYSKKAKEYREAIQAHTDAVEAHRLAVEAHRLAEETAAADLAGGVPHGFTNDDLALALIGDAVDEQVTGPKEAMDDAKEEMDRRKDEMDVCKRVVDKLVELWIQASKDVNAAVDAGNALHARSITIKDTLEDGELPAPTWSMAKCPEAQETGHEDSEDSAVWRQANRCRNYQRERAKALKTAHEAWEARLANEGGKGQTKFMLSVTAAWSYSLVLPGGPEPYAWGGSPCTQAPHFAAALFATNGDAPGANWFPTCGVKKMKAALGGSSAASAWRDLVLPECWCHEIRDEDKCNGDNACMYVDASVGCVSRWGTRDRAEWESAYCPAARRRRLRGLAAAGAAARSARALSAVGDTAAAAAREVGMKFLLGYLRSGRLQADVCLGKDAHCAAGDARRSVAGTVAVDPAAARGAELRLAVPAVKLGALAYMASGKHGEALLSAIGPVADVGLGDATLAVATTGTSLTMSASGSPLLAVGACKGVFACALAKAGEGVVVSGTSTVHTTGDAEIEMRYGVKATGTGRIIFSDGMTPPKGPSFFTSVGVRNKIVTTKAGATLPLQVCVEDCDKAVAERRHLRLQGELYFGVSPLETTASGELSMLGWWDRAFGAPMVHVGDLRVRAGFDVKTWPPAPTQLELGGRACLGSKAACVDGADGEMISALMYGGLGLVDPSGNYYVAMMTEVSLDKMFGVLAETMGAGNPFVGWRKSLPHAVKNSGLYPLDESCTNAQNADPAGNPHCFARLTVAPLAPATVVTNSGTMTIPRGFALAGRLKVGSSWTMAVEAKMTPTSFLIDAAMDPIKFGKLLTVSRSLGDTKNGPRFYMDFAMVPPKAAVEVRGAVQIPALGTKGECTVLLGADGYTLAARGRVFGALTADIESRWATGASSSKGFAFDAAVAVGELGDTVGATTGLIQDVVNQATKWADEVQDELDDAASYVNDACKRLKDKGKIDSVVYGLCKGLGSAAKASLKGVFSGAEHVLKAAKAAIDALVKAATRSLGKADFFSIEKLGLGGEISDGSTKTVAGKILGDIKKSVYKGDSGCTTKAPCNAGEGDCDKDSECKGAYKCFQRGKNGAHPPGVLLSADHKKGAGDFCYNPNMVGVKLCSASQPCAEGHGDCDNDSECAGALKCWQRGANGPPPPGVTLTSGMTKSATDFCYDPKRFSSSRVHGDLAFTYFGKKAAQSFDVDLSDAKSFAGKLAKQVFAEIKKLWKKIADLPSAAEKEFNKIKFVVRDAIEDAMKKVVSDVGGAIVGGVVQAGKAAGKAIAGTAKKGVKSVSKFGKKLFGRRLGSPYDFDSGIDLTRSGARLRDNGDSDAPRRLLTRRFE